MRPLLALAGLIGLGLLAASCMGSSQPAPAPAPPVIVNNMPPAADNGVTVLLAVVGVVAFLLLAGLVVALMSWASERRRRGAAEDAVVVLTGRPISQLALLLAPPISAERLHSMAAPFDTSEQLKALR